MNSSQLIEAVLLMENKAVAAEKLASACNITKQQVEHMIAELNAMYNQNQHGLEIIKSSTGYLLVPNKQVWPELSKQYVANLNTNITNQSMEVLSIIAYLQPITVSQISTIRGIKSAAIVEQLKNRELIDISGRKDAPGSPFLYSTTEQFLQAFGLDNLKSLPELPVDLKRIFEIP